MILAMIKYIEILVNIILVCNPVVSTKLGTDKLNPGEHYVLYNGRETSYFGLLVIVSNSTTLGRLVCSGELAQFDHFDSYVCHKLAFGISNSESSENKNISPVSNFPNLRYSFILLILKYTVIPSKLFLFLYLGGLQG